MTKTTTLDREFNKIITTCATKGSIYDEILDKYLFKNTTQKHELLSILTVSFANNKEKIVRAFNSGWFKYLFASAVKNQVASSTSRFHNDVRLSLGQKFQSKRDDIIYNQLSGANSIEDLKAIEDKLEIVNEAKDKVIESWYESEMVRLYFEEDLTYREIEELYDIDHVSVFLTIKAYKKKLTAYLEETNNLN